MSADLLGYLAACCTTGAFLPQVIQAWKSRDTRAISMPMYLVFVTGVLLWLAYGLQINNWPMTLANLVTLVLAGTVLALKLKYG
ncbi:MAG TPA: SemiSWEET transporter [Permianibacter sp.]|nr:SemiSWEET transporter [Permianibacter sp.]